MLKKSTLIVGSALVLGASLSAEEAAAEAAVVSEPVAVQLPAAPAVEVSEAELVEMVGFLTAQGGGVATLKLDEAGIATLAGGLQKGLKGELNIQDFPQEAMQAAFAQAAARAEAAQEATAELPAIDADALQKIGLVMVAQSGLEQLGFGAEDAAAITKGFIAGASATAPDPAMEAKMPAFQAFIQKRVAAAQAAAEVEGAAAAAESKVAGVVFDALNLDFALFVGRDDGVDQRGGGLAEGEFGDREQVLLARFDAGAAFYTAAAFAVVIFGHVGDPTGREVGHDFGCLFAQKGDTAFEELDKIVR